MGIACSRRMFGQDGRSTPGERRRARIGETNLYYVPERVTMNEEEVKALPTIQYGIDDVMNIVNKMNLSVGSAQTDSVDGPAQSGSGTRMEQDEESPKVQRTESLIRAAYDSCTSCSICLSPFEEEETLRLLPQCGHCFHTECILPWLTQKKSFCPLCQMPVKIKNDNDEEESPNSGS